jgi:hypothetical protein
MTTTKNRFWGESERSDRDNEVTSVVHQKLYKTLFFFFGDFWCISFQDNLNILCLKPKVNCMHYSTIRLKTEINKNIYENRAHKAELSLKLVLFTHVHAEIKLSNFH